MKKLLLSFAVIAAFGFAANAEDPEGWIDLTPEGLKFDTYGYEDGDAFPLFAPETNGSWSSPVKFYSESHPDAFEKNGQLTYWLERGQVIDHNNQAHVTNNMQPGVFVTTMPNNKYIGKALVVSANWSPMTTMYNFPYIQNNGYPHQIGFLFDNKLIKEETDKTHYIRVRLVLSAYYRGCHYTQHLADPVKLIESVYCQDDRGWVVPEDDWTDQYQRPIYGIDFAQWANETGKVEDIPAEPVVYEPADADVEYLDLPHMNDGAAKDPNGKPAYLINQERFMVLEFDAPVTAPAASTINVAVNLGTAPTTTYIFKEIRFFDLGTDESKATLIHKRQVSWRYYNEASQGTNTGIEDLTVDDNVAPVYYNLQGVQVANPDNGIYIVRRGNKVSKEYILK